MRRALAGLQTSGPPLWEPGLPAGTTTAMCGCGHHWYVHAASGRTARSDICHGWLGNATPGPYRPCDCKGFAPWSGPTDSRTGEPARMVTVATTPGSDPEARIALLEELASETRVIAGARIKQLEALAAEMLARFRLTQRADAYHASAGADEHDRWRKTLAGTP